MREGSILRNRYRLDRFIDRGGMSDVYLAYDLHRQTQVAVKLLRSDLAEDPEFVKRFQREADALARVDHPQIVRFYSFEVQGVYAFIVMDFIRGSTLRRHMREVNGPLPLDEVTSLLRQIGSALQYAHNEGIIHRDIKPGNIMIRQDGHAFLSDFGIARAAESSTMTQGPLGTPAYMSPEQILGRDLGFESDIYSLGLVMFEMVTGVRPFDSDQGLGTTVSERVRYCHLHLEAPNPSDLDPNIPAEASAVIKKSLAKEPDERWPSVVSMVQAWEEAMQLPHASMPMDAQVTMLDVPPPPPYATPPRQISVSSTPPRQMPVSSTPPRRSRKGWGIAAVVLVTVIAAIASYWFFGAGQAFFDQSPSDIPVADAGNEEPNTPDDGVSSAENEMDSGSTGDTGAIAEVTPSPTIAPPTSLPTMTPGVVIKVVTATPSSTSTPAPATDTPVPPTDTPVVIVVKTAFLATTTSTPTSVPTKAPPTKTPIPRPSQPGVVVDFEVFGQWRRGNEPHGRFEQSTTIVKDGNASGKLTYDIPAVAGTNYLIYHPVPAAPIPGQPIGLTVWVYGDGSNHFLNAWIQDAAGEVRQFPLGRIEHTDSWEPMTLLLDTTQDWPQQHISGPDNDKVDYPVRLSALVLDAEREDIPHEGVVYLDTIKAIDAIDANSTVTPQPTSGATNATPTAVPAPGGAPPGGYIVFTSGKGNGSNIAVVDVATKGVRQLFSDARQPDVSVKGQVAFNAIGGGKDNLFTIPVQGGHDIMAGLHPEDSYPHWSPTGISAVFHSSLQGDGQDRIYVKQDMGFAGEPEMLKVNGSDIYGRLPIWLKNWRIAFSGCNYWASGSNCGIWTVESNGSGNGIQLTERQDDRATDSYGDNLLYASQISGNWDVYVIPANGGSPRNLTNSPSQNAGATYSPDGQHIAFMSDRDGIWGIWIMRSDGSNPQKLIDVHGGFGPAWIDESLSWGG